jgi:peptide/nickel transport system substrate-binding protein
MTRGENDPQSGLGDELLSRREFAKYAGGVVLGASGAASLLRSPGVARAAGFRRQRLTAAQTRRLTIASPYITSNVEQETNNGDQNQQEFAQQVVEPLVDWKKKLRPDGNYDLDFSGFVPVLATSWQILDGGRSVIWHLRKGVKSSLGNELTAEGLKWNYERMISSGGVGSVFMLLLGISKPSQIKVLSKYSVKMTVPRPTNLWLNIQPQHVPAPLDAEAYMSHATKADPWALKWGTQNVVGFGPYMFETRTPGQRATFIRNPHYWRRSASFPHFDQLIFEEVPDPNIRQQLLQSGNADIAKSLSFRQMAHLPAPLKVNNFRRSSAQIAYPVNTLHSPLGDFRVRQAMAWAIPYQDILKNVFYGLASPTYGPLVTFSPTLAKSAWPYKKTDLNKAKALLKQAGHAKGFDMTFSYAIGTPENAVQAQIMKTALAPLGINVNLKQVTAAALNQAQQNHDFDISMLLGGSNDPDPYYSYWIFFLKKSLVNFSHYYNPLVQSLVTQLGLTLNPAKRESLSRRIQVQLNHDVPFLWIAEPGVQFPSRPNISGIYPRMIRELVYAELVKK